MYYKVKKEFIINNYTVLCFNELPTAPYKCVKIEDEIYEIVPSYDMENCIVINSQKSFSGKDVEFIL